MSGDSCNLQTSPGDWKKHEPGDNGASGNAHRRFTGTAPWFRYRSGNAESFALWGILAGYQRLRWVIPPASAPGTFPDSAL